MLASAGDVGNAIDGAYLSLLPGENSTFEVTVDTVNQGVGPTDPLLSLSVGLSRISTPNSTESRNPLAPDELAIFQGAGGALTSFLAAEGYTVDVECGVAPDIQWTRQSIANGLDEFTLAIPDDCGGVTAVYNATEAFILDSKTCPADNAVYIWYTTLPTATAPSQVQIYACQVKSGQASIYPAEVSEEFQAGQVNGPGNDTVDLAPVLPYAVAIAGDMFFDTQSLRGNVLLRQCGPFPPSDRRSESLTSGSRTFLQSGTANISDVATAQISVRVGILTVLAKLGDTLQTTANMVNSSHLTNIVVANMYEGDFVAVRRCPAPLPTSADSYRQTALKLHLSGSQLAWYLLPALLLLLVFGLLLYRVTHRSSGDCNFVDPVEVSLVSLRDVHGANTGRWAEYHEANLAATRYRFGVSPSEPNKLILTTDDNIRLEKPRSSTEYL